MAEFFMTAQYEVDSDWAVHDLLKSILKVVTAADQIYNFSSFKSHSICRKFAILKVQISLNWICSSHAVAIVITNWFPRKQTSFMRA